jgi:hypothetical protein
VEENKARMLRQPANIVFLVKKIKNKERRTFEAFDSVSVSNKLSTETDEVLHKRLSEKNKRKVQNRET